MAPIKMDRRDFAVGLGTAVLASGLAHAAPPADHTHPAGKATPTPPVTPLLRAVIDATQKCLQTGAACVTHCNDLLAAGDTSLAECQKTVLNMLAVCQATFTAAGYHSADPRNLKALAKACSGFCAACAKACEPHAGHHAECKACLASCEECIKACDAYAA